MVVEAVTGLEALRVAEKDHPDLILLDILLPELSGDEVIRLIKADPLMRIVPLIVLTSLAPEDERVKRAQTYGAKEIMLKPYTFKALGEAIGRYVPLSRESRF